MLLPIARESHLVEADVRHLDITGLEHRFVAVGFEVSPDLNGLLEGALADVTDASLSLDGPHSYA
jgi:hypothetical protein